VHKGKVYFKNLFAGIVSEDENGFSFFYDETYLKSEKAKPISLTMPLRNEPYTNSDLFPFFDGLIPEGWLLDIAGKNWMIDEKNRMELLLTFCIDCAGAVSVIPVME